MKILHSLMLPGLSLIPVSVADLPFDPLNSNLLWSDEFNEGNDGEEVPVNDVVWSCDNDETGPSGYGNGEIQTYTCDLEHVKQSDGSLFITTTRDDGDGDDGDGSSRLMSAGINSQNKIMVKYGTVVARIKTPDVNAGLWPSFWTMGNDWSVSNIFGTPFPASGSIKVGEVGQGLGLQEKVGNQRVVSALHWDFQNSHAVHAAWYDLPQDIPKLDEDFHFYTLVWNKTMITTYIDEYKIVEMDISDETCEDCEEFHREHFLVLNQAVGGFFTTDGCDSTIVMDCGPARKADEITASLPASMEVDWVRIYGDEDTVVSGPGTFTPTRAPTESENIETPTNTPPTPAPTDVPIAQPTEQDDVVDDTETPTPAPTPSPTAMPTEESVPTMTPTEEDDLSDDTETPTISLPVTSTTTPTFFAGIETAIRPTPSPTIKSQLDIQTRSPTEEPAGESNLPPTAASKKSSSTKGNSGDVVPSSGTTSSSAKGSKKSSKSSKSSRGSVSSSQESLPASSGKPAGLPRTDSITKFIASSICVGAVIAFGLIGT